MAKSKDLSTAEEYQRFGEHHYQLAAKMEDRDEPQKKIDACWGLASMYFWQALTLGSEKAPIWLFKCFRQGVGVEKDDYIRDIMYGAALKLTPQDAKNIKAENKPVIPKSKFMETEIKNLIKLVQNTHKEIPTKGISMDQVLEQMNKFNHAIKLPSGKLIQSCFTEKSTAATTHDEYGASTSSYHYERTASEIAREREVQAIYDNFDSFHQDYLNEQKEYNRNLDKLLNSLGQTEDETAMTGKDAEGYGCCIIL